MTTASADPLPAPDSGEVATLAPELTVEPTVEPTVASTDDSDGPVTDSGTEPTAESSPSEVPTEDAGEGAPIVVVPEKAPTSSGEPASAPALEDVPAEEVGELAAASLMATTAAGPTVMIDGEFVDLVVLRTATGTGHGTIAQCAINSSNPDLFPDGNVAGAPADDSPYDEYVCGRDSIQYQVELNFGQGELPTARTVTFDFNIVDQGSSVRALRFTRDVQRLCSSSVPGVYSGSTRVYSDTTWVRCALNIEAGVSGSVLLPPIDIEAVENQPFSRYLRPTLTFEGSTHVVPPATVISIPQQDARMMLAQPALNATQTPNPMLLVVDGQPGFVIAAATGYTSSPFDSTKWASYKGLSTRATNVMDYTVGSYVQGDGVNAPRPLPDSAIILTNSTAIAAGSVFRDPDGNVLDTRAMAAGSLPMSVGLWLPVDEIVNQGGFGMWVHADAHSITDELGNPNFGRAEPWDPGTGEACSFSTRSLGINGVSDGTTMPNNNCFRHWYTYGEYSEGPTAKLIENSPTLRQFRESQAISVSLTSPARITPDTGDLMFCDAWDAPDQTAAPRSPSQTLNLAVAPRFTTVVGRATLDLPADIWRVEYAHSTASMAGSLVSTGAIARCADDQAWTTDPTTIEGGVQTINTARFIVDRDGLRAFLETQGLVEIGDYLPALRGDLGFHTTSAASGDLPADGSTISVYDAYVVDWGRDVPGSSFIHTRYYDVRAPYTNFNMSKGVAEVGTNLYRSDLLSAAGQPLSYRLWFQPSYALGEPGVNKDFKITATDTLPACAVPEEPTVSLSTSTSWTINWTYIPPVGDPCHGEGEPGRIEPPRV